MIPPIDDVKDSSAEPTATIRFLDNDYDIRWLPSYEDRIDEHRPPALDKVRSVSGTSAAEQARLRSVRLNNRRQSVEQELMVKSVLTFEGIVELSNGQRFMNPLFGNPEDQGVLRFTVTRPTAVK